MKRKVLPHSAATAAALVLAGCGGQATAVPTSTPAPTASPAVAYHLIGHGLPGRPVKVQDTVAGRPIYVLKATDVYYSTSTTRGTFENDTILFYKGSAVRLTVVAPTADVNTTTYDFVLRGGVHARSAQGIVLVCDVMAYNGKTQLLTGEGHVRVIDAQGDTLTGDKAVADLDLQQIHMFGNVGIGQSGR